MKCADVGSLLEETPQAYYWMGFLMADGYLSAKRVTLTLALEDEEHLRRFGNFIRYSGRRKAEGNSQSISAMDTCLIPRLKRKFDLDKQKTYKPPAQLPDVPDDLLLSLIIGFIDGDGCIRAQTGRIDPALTVKVHDSWLDIMEDMSCFLHERAGCSTVHARINNAGYAFFTVTNSIVLKYIKKGALRLQLPVLARKWDKVDLAHVSRAELGLTRVGQVKEASARGLSLQEMADTLNLKYNTVYMICRRNAIAMNKDKEVRQVETLAHEGLTIKQIAAELKLNYKAVYLRCKRHSIAVTRERRDKKANVKSVLERGSSHLA